MVDSEVKLALKFSLISYQHSFQEPISHVDVCPIGVVPRYYTGNAWNSYLNSLPCGPFTSSNIGRKRTLRRGTHDAAIERLSTAFSMHTLWYGTEPDALMLNGIADSGPFVTRAVHVTLTIRPDQAARFFDMSFDMAACERDADFVVETVKGLQIASAGPATTNFLDALIGAAF